MKDEKNIMELNDENLEQVTGGSTKEGYTFYKYYCGNGDCDNYGVVVTKTSDGKCTLCHTELTAVAISGRTHK